MLKDRDMNKIIKSGTLGTWIKGSQYHVAQAGARVMVTADCNTYGDMVEVKWLDDLAGIPSNEFSRQNDGGYFISDFEFDVEQAPVFDVNKTVEIVATTSELGDYIIIGQLLLTIPLSPKGNLFTRSYLQDGCYRKYGWDVSDSDEAIDLCVAKGLFKLV